MATNDPDFEQKAADIIGLYLNPPAHAAVFSGDEKTAIQALDRKDPMLPLSPGRAERHGFEYFRHYNKVPKTIKWRYFDPTRRITPSSAVTAHWEHRKSPFSLSLLLLDELGFQF
jgi:hypothetical protein